MRICSSSYSALGLGQADFVKVCHRVASELPGFMRSVDATHAVVRGSSGLSVAFGLRMLSDLRIVVARKPGENSHGDAVSAVGSSSEDLHRYVILDDFVSSGSTVAGIVRDLDGAQCVGLFLYNGAGNPACFPKVAMYGHGVVGCPPIPSLQFRSY
jgi:hypothetical protein